MYALLVLCTLLFTQAKPESILVKQNQLAQQPSNSRQPTNHPRGSPARHTSPPVVPYPRISPQVVPDPPSNQPSGSPLNQQPSGSPSLNEPPRQGYSQNYEIKPSDGILKIEIVPQAPDIWFKAYVIATGIIALLNVGMLMVIWRQKAVMVGQLEEMKEGRKQTDKLIEQAAVQANAALSAARAAENNYEIMRNSERPWVLVENIKLNMFAANEKLHCSIFVKNYGRTPAFLREHKFVFRLMKSIPKPPLEYSPFPFEFQQEVITPNAIARVWVPFHEERLTSRQIETLRNRNEFLYVFGFFKYGDGTGNTEYETRFFFVYDLPVLEGYEFLPAGPVEYNKVK